MLGLAAVTRNAAASVVPVSFGTDLRLPGLVRAEQERLLLRIRYGLDRRHDAEMVLVDLTDGGIGRRDDDDHLREGPV